MKKVVCFELNKSNINATFEIVIHTASHLTLHFIELKEKGRHLTSRFFRYAVGEAQLYPPVKGKLAGKEPAVKKLFLSGNTCMHFGVRSARAVEGRNRQLFHLFSPSLIVVSAMSQLIHICHFHALEISLTAERRLLLRI